MRESSKSRVVNAVQDGVQQSYHGRNDYGLNYAFQGFQSNKYFTSDRFITLSDTWQRQDGKELKGFGLEIEVECDTICSSDILSIVLKELILKHFPKDLFKFQRDGSLRGSSSTEIITQVMTKEFIRNHYPDFKAMWNSFKVFGIDAYNSGHCGMHVNISNACFGKEKKTQEEAIKKLYYLINKYFDIFKYVFYRKERQDTSYYARYSGVTIEKAKELNLNNFSSDHYHCLNFGHWNEGRIELRIVGGQKDYGSFRNTMECVFFIIERCKTITWNQCEDLAQVFKGCNQYVYDRLTMPLIRNQFTNAQLEDIRANVVTEQFI